MLQLLVIRWRDIPAQIIIREGRTTEKRELSARFAEAIDRAAMRAGLKDSDAYLGQWRREAEPGLLARCTDAGSGAVARAEVADRVAAFLERDYDDDRLKQLVLAGGLASGRDAT